MRRLGLVFCAVALVVSGCLSAQTLEGDDAARVTGRGGVGATDLSVPVDWSERALVGGEGHDHGEHAQHVNLSTPNFQVLGWDPIITDYHGRTAGGHLCGDAVEHEGKRLSVVHSFTTDVAAIITDVTDATNPKKLGEVVMANTHVYDLALTPDQDFLLLATSPLGAGPDSAGLPLATAAPLFQFRDACTGELRPMDGPETNLPFASGVVLVDISNPLNPSVVDFRFFPILGGHSVHAQEIDGQTLILATIANLPGHASFYVFMGIIDTPAGPKLEIQSIYQWRPEDPEQYAAMATHTNHDGYLHKHPITGQVLAYLAYGNDGLVILDVDDPSEPVFLSHWADWDAVGGPGPGHYFHEALPIDGTWDGRHFTFAGEECVGRPADTPTCLAYAFDTTDPTDPKLVGVWTLPHDVGWSASLEYSLHYLGVVNKTLFVTTYHGGLWAVDASDLTQTPQNLLSTGVFMPPNVSPKPPGPTAYSPRVNDLNTFSDGVMVVYDAQTGVYTVRFDDARPAPPPEPWAVV